MFSPSLQPSQKRVNKSPQVMGPFGFVAVSDEINPGMTPVAESEMVQVEVEGMLPSPMQLSSPRIPAIERLRYDVPPSVPLKLPLRRLLEITELPFMILWTFFTFWLVILIFSFQETTPQMWASAVFAGVLVGLALNANAYKYIVKPKTRSRKEFESNTTETFTPDELSDIPEDLDENNSIHSQDQKNRHLRKMVVRFPRFFSQLVATKRPCVRRTPLNRLPTMPPFNEVNLSSIENQNNQTISSPSAISPRHAFSSGMNSLTKLAKDWSNFADTLEWELDVPTVVRFFIIPFAVSTLSGMTSDEDKYVLVFPKNTLVLILTITVPAAWVMLLMVARLTLLYKLRVVWRWKIVFFNGCLIH